MNNEKITFFEEGEYLKKSGSNWKKIILILSPLIIFGLISALWLYSSYSTSKKILYECNIVEKDLFESMNACQYKKERCTETKTLCALEKVNKFKPIQDFFLISSKIMLMAVFWFLLLHIFENKYITKTSKWVRSVAFSIGLVLALSIPGSLLPPVGILGIYLLPIFVITGAIVSMLVFRYSFYSSLLISIISLSFLFVLNLLF